MEGGARFVECMKSKTFTILCWTITCVQLVTFWGRLYEAWIAYPADKS